MPDPLNPNRLDGSPPLGQPAMGTQPVPNAGISPTGTALLSFSPTVALVLIVLSTIAGGIAALPTMGVALPPVVVGIASLVATTLAALGIGSAGARRKE